ncbi:IS3 family transposase [Isoptericola sp. BMS4]|uniref:IS3 family transposase n=1 Tax=Isoptericola sp. BMS4 TaxID=2527875 RepID=UPI00141FDDE3|nr:IS3 family transposase [Isoptericola sp. BMS4]
MPAAKSQKFRRRAVDLARRGDAPVRQVANDLGVSESCLRRWMAQDDVDAGRREGLTSAERKELVELRRRTWVLEMENEIVKHASAYFARENVLPERSPGAFVSSPTTGCPSRWRAGCWASRGSGFYEATGRAPSPRAVADEQVSATITQIHQASRATYGAPRLHAELRLGLGIRCGRKRVARLMRDRLNNHREGGPLSDVARGFIFSRR